MYVKLTCQPKDEGRSKISQNKSSALKVSVSFSLSKRSGKKIYCLLILSFFALAYREI